jgi:hypothetical protein
MYKRSQTATKGNYICFKQNIISNQSTATSIGNNNHSTKHDNKCAYHDMEYHRTVEDNSCQTSLTIQYRIHQNDLNKRHDNCHE